MDDDKKNKGRGSGPSGGRGKPGGKRFGPKPAGAGASSGGQGRGGKRPFSGERPPRGEGGEASFRKRPRPDRNGEERGKPFDKQRNDRPGRAEREEARAAGEQPRSFGMRRHTEAARPEGAGKPRSYGTKSHPGAARGESRPHISRPEAAGETGERIAKRLARAGIASRREAEDLVAAGRVKVNGRVLASPAVNVAPDDRIELDGVEIPPIERTRLFLFHKPAGVVTTSRDPEGRRTVFDVLPEGLPRLITVGRLDINTEGLLLLTNDGGLARVLELPSTGWLRRYRVRVHGAVDEKALAGLKEGIAVGGVFYGAIEASLERVQGTNAWLSIGLREGKNREVRNVLGALGLEVTRLIRVSFGPFQLGELPEGEVRELKGRTLRDQLGDRLIEEAGANFEAPVTKPFSSRTEQRRPAAGEGAARPPRQPRPLEVGEGGLIKSRKRRREEARDEALGKLSTRPQRGFAQKPFGKAARSERDAGAGASAPRKANVWMAPGARPQGKTKPAAGSGEGGRKAPRGRGPGRAGAPRPPRKG